MVKQIYRFVQQQKVGRAVLLIQTTQSHALIYALRARCKKYTRLVGRWRLWLLVHRPPPAGWLKQYEIWRESAEKRGMRMRKKIKRGAGYLELGLSGPQSTNVLNRAAATAERLSARNEWAFQMSQLYPDLPRIIQIERVTQYPITRFDREMVLKYDEKDGWWEIKARVREDPPRKTGKAAALAPPPDDSDSNGADGGSANSTTLKPAADTTDKPSAPKRDDVDEYRPISAAPRRVRVHPTPQSRLAGFLHDEWQRVRETSLFCHIASAFEDQRDKMKRALRHFVDRAQHALVLSHELYVDVYASFIGAEQIVQDQLPGAVLEQTYEHAGRRLTLLTYSAYPRPNWESWLFGRLYEDDQVAA